MSLAKGFGVGGFMGLGNVDGWIQFCFLNKYPPPSMKGKKCAVQYIYILLRNNPSSQHSKALYR